MNGFLSVLALSTVIVYRCCALQSIFQTSLASRACGPLTLMAFISEGQQLAMESAIEVFGAVCKPEILDPRVCCACRLAVGNNTHTFCLMCVEFASICKVFFNWSLRTSWCCLQAPRAAIWLPGLDYILQLWMWWHYRYYSNRFTPVWREILRVHTEHAQNVIERKSKVQFDF